MKNYKSSNLLTLSSNLVTYKLFQKQILNLEIWNLDISNYVISNFVVSNFVISNFVISNFVISNFVISNFVILNFVFLTLFPLSWKGLVFKKLLNFLSSNMNNCTVVDHSFMIFIKVLTNFTFLKSYWRKQQNVFLRWFQSFFKARETKRKVV